MKVLCLIFVLFAIAVTAADLIRCGQVIDGLSVDVDFLQVNSRVQASWSGFEDGKERNRIIRYEWAIISSDIASSSVLGKIQNNSRKNKKGIIFLIFFYFLSKSKRKGMSYHFWN